MKHMKKLSSLLLVLVLALALAVPALAAPGDGVKFVNPRTARTPIPCIRFLTPSLTAVL